MICYSTINKHSRAVRKNPEDVLNAEPAENATESITVWYSVVSLCLSYLGGILTPLSSCLRLLACLDTWISSSQDSGSCFL